jgi:transcriptional regulator with XRE-family HTH domain
MRKVTSPVTDAEWKKAGDSIRIIREEKDLTQENVADKAGITASYFARIERGEERPTIDVIKSIVRALRIKMSNILPF